MASKDFEPEFREERDMPPEVHEKTPGVYVRAENELPHELDMLWSNTRTYHKEERSPLISFIAGLLVGVILTSAVFLLFFNQPHIKTGENQMTAPMTEDLEGAQTPAGGSSAAGTSPDTASSAPAGGTTYTVVSGDTLGRISGKVYGSTAPKYLEKIQRANNLSSPDALQIDQKLIIPPKDY
jgi:hypothetical protein